MPWKKGNRFHAVSEEDAPPQTQAIYEEIRQRLGVPQVNLLFQVYASYPGFFALQWKTFRPILESGEFFHLADRLRADAYTRVHNYFEIANLRRRLDALGFTEDAKKELTNSIDIFSYSDPLMLLISAAQQQAFDGAIGTGCASTQPPTPIHFENRPYLVDEDSAEPGVRRILDEIKQEFGLPLVSQGFRAIARWPDLLTGYWELLQPLLASPLYRECQFHIHESAWTLARELPGTMDMTIDHMDAIGMSEDDFASVVRLTETFTRGLSSSLLNISIAKIAVEGGNQAESISRDEMNRGIVQEPTPNQAA